MAEASNAVAKHAYVWNPQVGRGLIDIVLQNGTRRRWEIGDQVLFLVLTTMLNSDSAYVSPQNLLYVNSGIAATSGMAEARAFAASGGENPFPWAVGGKASAPPWESAPV